jgi:hypothetical protein
VRFSCHRGLLNALCERSWRTQEDLLKVFNAEVERLTANVMPTASPGKNCTLCVIVIVPRGRGMAGVELMVNPV